jgi:hypothetical protein
VGVWTVGPNCDGGGGGDQMASQGVCVETTYIEPGLNIYILYIHYSSPRVMVTQ